MLHCADLGVGPLSFSNALPLVRAISTRVLFSNVHMGTNSMIHVLGIRRAMHPKVNWSRENRLSETHLSDLHLEAVQAHAQKLVCILLKVRADTGQCTQTQIHF